MRFTLDVTLEGYPPFKADLQGDGLNDSLEVTAIYWPNGESVADPETYDLFEEAALTKAYNSGGEI